MLDVAPMRTTWFVIIIGIGLGSACKREAESEAHAAPAAAEQIASDELVKAKKDDWLGKQVTVTGPLASSFVPGGDKPQGGVALGKPGDGPHVNCVFSVANPKADALAPGAALRVRGKVASFAFGDVDLASCEVLDTTK
jgi:hypothetical protein